MLGSHTEKVSYMFRLDTQTNIDAHRNTRYQNTNNNKWAIPENIHTYTTDGF